MRKLDTQQPYSLMVLVIRVWAHYRVPPVSAARSARRARCAACGGGRAACGSRFHTCNISYDVIGCPPAHSHQGCKVMLALEKAKLDSGLPDPDSAYWN